MAKNGRNLWTEKISNGSAPRGGGKWTIDDLKQKISNFDVSKQKIISARDPKDDPRALPEIAHTPDAKRIARNAALREKYRDRKTDRIEKSLTGSRPIGRILGIDPSLRGTGLSVIESAADGSLRYVESRTIKNPPKMTMAECLARIYEQTRDMIARNKPICAAIEQCVYVQNFKTALILGSSRGAAIAAVSCADLQVFEYPPLRIKQAVIGYGRASKEQVAKSVAGLVSGAGVLPPDEADASGAALTHIFTHKL